MFDFINIETNKNIERSVNIDLIEDIYYQKVKAKKITKSLQKEIAKINDKIPLYDVYSENVYLITKFNVYNRVVNQHYRFPNKNLIDSIKNKNIESNDPLKDRIIKKRKLILDFISYYDLKVLEDTYIILFYKFSEKVGKNLTNCKRPSFTKFFKHLKPYYTRSELINTALNMQLIVPSKEYYDQKKIEELCPKIVENDINKDILLKHHKYILDRGRVGIVQYYSLQGSFFMNKYLRGKTRYKSKNNFIEKLINTMSSIVNNAPSFNKSYTVYRFVRTEEYLIHLNVGDIFIDNGFMSTTRDPFYNSDEFKFGFILIKIHIPGNKKGVGLCMESVSHFPKEQEIILPPGTKLKLIKKDTDCDYYHTNISFATKISSRYEFNIIGKEDINLDREISFKPKKINFLKEVNIGNYTLEEKISRFVKYFCGEQSRFKVDIGNIEYDTVVEWYDSTSVYSDFYYVNSENGICMYSINKDNVSFFLEITQQILYVNYYFQHSLTDRDNKINTKDFLIFISSVAYYFDIPRVIIFTDYELGEYSYGLGNHCKDYYDYLLEGIERFPINEISVKPKFRYYSLDRMKNIKLKDILKKSDTDELYQIQKKLYDGKDNLKDFYLWIVKNYSYLIDKLIEKTRRVFMEDNPFEYDYYMLDPYGFLFRNKLTSVYREIRGLSNDDIQPKNIYRVTNKTPRAPTNRVV